MKYIICNGLLEEVCKLINLAIQLGGTQIALWFYPDFNIGDGNDVELNNSTLYEFKHKLDKIEKVTIYNGEKYCDKFTYNLNYDSISVIVSEVVNDDVNLDSISIYRENETEWFMAMIFHEDVCVVKDLLAHEERILKDNGFNVSDLPPDGW